MIEDILAQRPRDHIVLVDSDGGMGDIETPADDVGVSGSACDDDDAKRGEQPKQARQHLKQPEFG